MKCNICGGTRFIDQGSRQAVRCAECGSLERTRMLWLALEQMTAQGRIGRETRVLHIAPERGIYGKLCEIVSPETYDTADLFPELFTKFAPQTKRIDLCDLDAWTSEEYDLILHSHVLEHIPCNLAYPVYHLHRMLKRDGRHMFIVPFFNGKSEECFQEISDEERIRRLGQADHVRRFGKGDIERHLGAILNMPKKLDAEIKYGAETLSRANIPEAHWYGYTGATILCFDRNDMKFLATARAQT